MARFGGICHDLFFPHVLFYDYSWWCCCCVEASAARRLVFELWEGGHILTYHGFWGIFFFFFMVDARGWGVGGEGRRKKDLWCFFLREIYTPEFLERSFFLISHCGFFYECFVV